MLSCNIPIPRKGNVSAKASLYTGWEAANIIGFMELFTLTKQGSHNPQKRSLLIHRKINEH